MKMYFIDGWRVGRPYFMSFGWSEDQIRRMEAGEVIVHGPNRNEFEIREEED